MKKIVKLLGLFLLMVGAAYSGKYVYWFANPSQGLVEVAGWQSYQDQRIYTAELLIQFGANPNYISSKTRGYTSLMNAAVWDNGEIANLLLSKNADPNVRVNGNSDTNNAYDIACIHNSENVLRVFNSRGIRATRNHEVGVLGKSISELCNQV